MRPSLFNVDFLRRFPISRHVHAHSHLLITCRHCQHEFRAVAKLAGKEVPCPYCDRPLKITGDTASAAPDPLINKQLGGCRLTKRLGAGAMGLVYAAETVADGKPVALKMLSHKAAADESMVKRFHREAELCAQINHPHMVHVLSSGLDRGVNYIVMELVDGGTLAGLINEHGQLSWEESLTFVRHVAKALEQAATLNIVHRDIKPANILVGNDGFAKLADLGVAKQFDDDHQEPVQELTMQGVAIGSPAYMSPEQVSDARSARAPADIYSLGATWYHMLSGAPPFSGRNGAHVMMMVVAEMPKPINERVADLPVGIAYLVTRMLAKDASDRPQSATDLLTELDAIENDPHQIHTKRSIARRHPAPTSDVGLLVMIGLLVLVLVGVGAAIWFSKR